MDAVPTAIALRREPGAFTRSLAALLLRLGLGMIFLFAGLGKLKSRDLPPDNPAKYPEMITKSFPDKIAFPGDVKLFSAVLPYAEIGLGAALIAGFWTPIAAFLAGALLLALLFGHVFKNRIEMYPTMMSYLLVDAAILWISPVTSNYLSLDGLLFGWFWAPRPAGHYQHQPEEPARGRR
jgi:uncharacterized membrane protein YphA (DoxX/SURF4 family)